MYIDVVLRTLWFSIMHIMTYASIRLQAKSAQSQRHVSISDDMAWQRLFVGSLSDRSLCPVNHLCIRSLCTKQTLGCIAKINNPWPWLWPWLLHRHKTGRRLYFVIKTNLNPKKKKRLKTLQNWNNITNSFHKLKLIRHHTLKTENNIPNYDHPLLNMDACVADVQLQEEVKIITQPEVVQKKKFFLW